MILWTIREHLVVVNEMSAICTFQGSNSQSMTAGEQHSRSGVGSLYRWVVPFHQVRGHVDRSSARSKQKCIIIVSIRFLHCRLITGSKTMCRGRRDG